eukprot:SAG31_NODE_45201_length_259_cov_1.837500_1_plen_34_part_10
MKCGEFLVVHLIKKKNITIIHHTFREALKLAPAC